MANLGALDGGVPAALLLIEPTEQEVHLPVQDLIGMGLGTSTDGALALMRSLLRHEPALRDITSGTGSAYQKPGTCWWTAPKAWHHQQNRIGVQESSPQNNFRRIIACYIPKDSFCNHLINYFPENELRIPPYLLLALLNSNLSDWYFRLGSTNAHINHYQLYNLPAPQFAADRTDASILSQFSALLDKRDFEGAFTRIESQTANAPFPQTTVACLTLLVERIVKAEAARGAIARTERSELAEAARPYQRMIDRILFRLAGLTDAEAEGLEKRLDGML